MVVDSLYRTVTGIFLCRADKRIVSASAPLPLISATVEAGAPMFQSVGEGFYPARGLFVLFPFLCLRRVTFFPCRKKVTKERHLRKGGFRFPPFLKNLFPLKRPKGRGYDPSPLETSPGVLGDYQIAPLPRSGKGRWRPRAAGGIKRGTDSHASDVGHWLGMTGQG